MCVCVCVRVPTCVCVRGCEHLYVQSVRLEGMEDKLVVPGHVRQRLTNGQCQVCETQVRQLKQEAVTMLRSIQLAQTAHSARAANIPALVGSCNLDLQHR